MNTRSKQQIKSESVFTSESGNILSVIQSVDESDDDHKKLSANVLQHTSDKWNAYREYEQQQLETIKLLTAEEMLNIDQWLSDVNQVYEELRYPISRRIWQTLLYLQDDERSWYEHEKQEIKNDWNYFCKKLKQHIYDRLKLVSTSSTDRHSTFVNHMQQEELFSSKLSSSVEVNSSLASALSFTMAREIIKSPTYFRGAKDDVIEWLEKLEQRFAMANWTNDLKLQYISIHLQEDAYRWWKQSSTKITTWPCFVESIKQAFGSTKLKESTFEQLRMYKQAINQSITQYYDKVIELCNRVDSSMTDSMKLQYLMAGVKQSLKLHIALYDPQSSEAFLSYARKVEDTLSLTSTDYDLNRSDSYQNMGYDCQLPSSTTHFPPDTNSQSTNVHKTQSTTSAFCPTNNFRNKNVSYSSFPKKSKLRRSSNVCYTCGTPGHYSRDCTRSHFH